MNPAVRGDSRSLEIDPQRGAERKLKGALLFLTDRVLDLRRVFITLETRMNNGVDGH
jgi:hypothetical protein